MAKRDDLETLKRLIEETRAKLYQLIDSKNGSLLDEEVVILNAYMDRLINQYMNCKK